MAAAPVGAAVSRSWKYHTATGVVGTTIGELSTYFFLVVFDHTLPQKSVTLALNPDDELRLSGIIRVSVAETRCERQRYASLRRQRKPEA